jgi:hypothetical protein
MEEAEFQSSSKQIAVHVFLEWSYWMEMVHKYCS